MTKEFAHEGLAKPHHFAVASPFRIEVRPAFASTHRQGSERVFKNLLEGEELQDAKVDRRMEPEAAFVRPDGAVHLDPVAPVNGELALVILPWDPKHDDALRFDDSLD